MDQNFIVTADRGHLRIYEEQHEPGQTPRLRIVEAMDFPQGKQSYTANNTDMAGRWNSSKHQTGTPGAPGMGRTGMSIDERLPMKEEVERRNVQVIAGELDTFLRNRPRASWDFAAPSSLYKSVIEALSEDTRGRLRRALPKDLVNQSSEEVRAHFAAAGK